jgi:hypothetical protein
MIRNRASGSGPVRKWRAHNPQFVAVNRIVERVRDRPAGLGCERRLASRFRMNSEIMAAADLRRLLVSEVVVS